MVHSSKAIIIIITIIIILNLPTVLTEVGSLWLCAGMVFCSRKGKVVHLRKIIVGTVPFTL
jgi:hypothetical protein